MEQAKSKESEVLLGIAKKMNAELEDLNVRDHGTVLQTLATLGRRRGEIFTEELKAVEEQKAKDFMEQQRGMHEPRIVRPS